jgi:hypothetical protein
MTDFSSSEMVYELMYLAFLDMREEAARTENKVVYHLCDLFHVVPKMLKQVEKGEIEYKDVLDFIKDKAEEGGSESWLQHNIEQLKKG